MRLRRGALLALVLGACADPDPIPPAVTLTLGTVDASGAGFLPLAGDQPLVPGAQGGFHIWVKYRTRGLAAQTVRVLRTARRVSDERLVLKVEGVQDIGAPDSSGIWELAEPLPAFMCPSPLGVNIVGEPIRFTVEILDVQSGDSLGEASAVATPRCPTDAQREFCERICVG